MKFQNTFCSQCGEEFGPGDHGFSHCKNHQKKRIDETTMSEYVAGFDAGYAYVLNEIEQWIKRESHDPQRIAVVLSLLAHLKLEDKSNGTPPNNP